MTKKEKLMLKKELTAKYIAAMLANPNIRELIKCSTFESFKGGQDEAILSYASQMALNTIYYMEDRDFDDFGSLDEEADLKELKKSEDLISVPHEADLVFLSWLKGRLINVYKENPNVDFIYRLDKVINNYEKLLGE